MQADAGLVEDVEHLDELRPYLRRQTYALALTAREGRGDTIHRQIAQPDIEEEGEARAYLLEHLGGDLSLGLRKLRHYLVDPGRELCQLHHPYLAEVLVSYIIM